MSDNNRQFARCPVPDDPMSVLVVNGREIRCKLTEMSIGGFGIIVTRKLKIPQNSLAVLKTRGLDYIVQITHQKPTDNGAVVVGLKRVEEVVPPNSIYAKSPVWVSKMAWATAAGAVAAAVYVLFLKHE